MEFYLVFLVFYVHLVHIFPPNFSVRRHGIQAVGGLLLLIFVKRMSSHNGVFCSFGVKGSASFAVVLVLCFIQKLVLVIIPEVC